MFFLVLYLQNSEQLKIIPASDFSQVPSIFIFFVLLTLLSKTIIYRSFLFFADFMELYQFT